MPGTGQEKLAGKTHLLIRHYVFLTQNRILKFSLMFTRLGRSDVSSDVSSDDGVTVSAVCQVEQDIGDRDHATCPVTSYSCEMSMFSIPHHSFFD
jgi:hypothetical protein